MGPEPKHSIDADIGGRGGGEEEDGNEVDSHVAYEVFFTAVSAEQSEPEVMSLDTREGSISCPGGGREGSPLPPPQLRPPPPSAIRLGDSPLTQEVTNAVIASPAVATLIFFGAGFNSSVHPRLTIVIGGTHSFVIIVVAAKFQMRREHLRRSRRLPWRRLRRRPSF